MNSQVDKMITDAKVKKRELTISFLQNGRDMMKQNIEKLLEELQSVRLELSTYKQSFEKTLSEVNRLSKEKEKLKRVNTKLKSKNDNLRLTNSAHLEANALLAESHRDVKLENVKLKEQNRLLALDFESLQAENLNLKIQSEEAISTLSSKCERYLADVEVLRAKNKILKTKSLKINASIEKIKEELSTHIIVEEDLRARLEKEKKAVAAVQLELDKASVEANSQKQTTKEIIAELQLCRKKVHELEDQKKKLLKKLSNEVRHSPPNYLTTMV